MVTYKIVLDQRRSKSDGKYPLMFRVTFQRNTTNYSTGINLSPEYWNAEASTIKSSVTNFKELNKNLTTKFLKLQKAILQLEDDDRFSFESLKEFLSDKPVVKVKKETFLSFSNQLIAELIAVKRTGNAIVYQTGVNRLMNFVNDKTIAFEQITYSLLNKFQNQLIKDGVKPNTIGNYFRSIRAIYNKAIKAKLVDASLYPFKDIKIKTEKTAKRALVISDLEKLFTAKYAINTPRGRAQRYFILSFALRGISFTDMAYLTTDNIILNRIHYKRRKTHAALDIKPTPIVYSLIEQFKSPNRKYLLPVLPSGIDEDSLNAKKVLFQWIKTTNKWLREIAKDCKIEANITTYVTRHSWATAAKKLGYSNEIIAECLGHQYGNKITNIYLDSFDQDVIDEVNEKVLKSVTL